MDKYRVLVIVGTWNTPLFATKWINENLFDNNLSQNISVEYVISNDHVTHKTIKTGMIDIEVSPVRLCFLADPEDREALSQVADIATRVATLLPHTPYQSFGVNVLIHGQNIGQEIPPPVILDHVFDSASHTLTYTRQNDANQKINILLKQSPGGGALVDCEVNFHYDISSAAEFKKYLRDSIFEEAEALAKEILGGVSNER